MNRVEVSLFYAEILPFLHIEDICGLDIAIANHEIREQYRNFGVVELTDLSPFRLFSECRTRKISVNKNCRIKNISWIISRGVRFSLLNIAKPTASTLNADFEICRVLKLFNSHDDNIALHGWYLSAVLVSGLIAGGCALALRDLALWGNVVPDPSTIVRLLSACTGLKHLRISEAWLVPILQSGLILPSVTSLSCTGSIPAQFGLSFPSIESLDVSGCRVSRNMIVGHAISSCNHLKVLFLSRVSIHFNHDFEIIWASSCPQLTRLSLHGTNADDNTMLILAKYCSNLVQLDISDTHVCVEGLNHLSQGVCSLELLKTTLEMTVYPENIVFDKLTHLHWCCSGRYKLRDAAMTSFLLRHTGITCLFMSHANVSDSSVHTIAQCCHSLIVIRFQYCDHVSDEGFAALFHSNNQIQLFEAIYCKGLTDVGLQRISLCAAKLRSLSVSCDIESSGDSIYYEDHQPFQQRVSITGISSIFNQCLELRDIALNSRMMGNYLALRTMIYDAKPYLNVSLSLRSDHFNLRWID